MFNLSKGYKQGRAVMFYDLAPVDGSTAREMVSKDEVVELCNKGQIANAKIQMWEGKAIVRCNNKHLPLVRVDESGQVIGTAQQSVRGANKETERHETVVSVADKSVVAGKVKNKAPKRNISFAGYDYSNIIEKNERAKTIDYTGIVTVSDLFDKIGNDFRLKQLEDYKKEFAKKAKLEARLVDLGTVKVKMLQNIIATYLMNMAYDEIKEVYELYS